MVLLVHCQRLLGKEGLVAKVTGKLGLAMSRVDVGYNVVLTACLFTTFATPVPIRAKFEVLFPILKRGSHVLESGVGWSVSLRALI